MSKIKGKTSNYYKLLNLKTNASNEEIKNSYLKLKKHWDPKINKSKLAKERLEDLNRAYKFLSNKKLKNKLDKKIKNKKKNFVNFNLNNLESFGDFNNLDELIFFESFNNENHINLIENEFENMIENLMGNFFIHPFNDINKKAYDIDSGPEIEQLD